MKITKTAVERIKPPALGQDLYRDNYLKGFGVRVTVTGVKSFFIEKRIQGKVKRITLGRYPELTVEMARKEAQKLLGKIASGIDPIADEKERILRRVTLEQAFQDYLKARKSLKARTIFDYHQVMKESFADWQHKSLLGITKDMVAKRHTEVGKRSHARANLGMRVLRAVFNFAMGEYEDARGHALITENPVNRLSHTKAWYKVSRRQTVIRKHELSAWYDALSNIQPERTTNKFQTIKDYLLFILFTGLRRAEAAKLQWGQVDFLGKTVTVLDPKNGEDHVLPLSDFLLDLLVIRKQNSDSMFVFPGNSKTGYIIEPRKVMHKVTAISGVSFTLHDLRRTFITVAESLDIPVYALKRLLNHKMNNDVTAGYLVMDVERLRRPMQLITDFLLKNMQLKVEKKVIKLRAVE